MDSHRNDTDHRAVSAAGPPAVFAAMQRTGLIFSAVAFPIIVIVFWLVRGTDGAGASALGALVATIFFAGGLAVMARVVTDAPLSLVAGAMAVFFGQLIFLFAIVMVLSGQDWLDATAFGLTIFVLAILWQIAQIVAYVRTPKPVYDLPADNGSGA